jgi:hypothetical protein
MPKIVMDALSHQAIRALGTEGEHYRHPPERTGQWRGKRLTGVEQSLADAGHTLTFSRPDQVALADAAVLIVASRSQTLMFNETELTAIRDFVQGGGGLLLMANHQHFIMPQQQVVLSLELPLGFIDGTIAGFPPIKLAEHPLTAGCDEIVVRNSTSMVTRDPAVRIAHFVADPRHFFAVATGARRGRVLATGDSGFIASSDDTGKDMFASGSNATFFANAIRWLAGA